MTSATHLQDRDVVIVSAVRTPIGAIRGALSGVRPDDLAAHIIKAAVERSGVSPDLIEEVILGCANQAGEDNRNAATRRQSAHRERHAGCRPRAGGGRRAGVPRECGQDSGHGAAGCE